MWLLGHYQLFIIFNCDFLKPEEAEVGEDLIQGIVIAICADGITFEKDSSEYFKKILISNTPVEDLFYKYFFIWVFEFWKVVIGVGVNSIDDWIECLYAFDTFL